MINITGSQKMFHLNIDKNDVGKYVILCGDPGRVEKIAKCFENPEFIAFNREFKTYTGYLNGEKVSAVSTGIGGPSAAICMEELIMCGCHTFIRVGTSGAIPENINAGDIIIADSAVRDDGTSREYLPVQYPATADFYTVSALVDAADKLTKGKNKKFFVGTVQSKDSFYGETNPETMAVKEFLYEKWSAYERLGCLCSEMECASIFSVAKTRGVRAAAVLLAIWNITEHNTKTDYKVDTDTSDVILCAVDALKQLILKDKQNAI